MKWKYKKCMVLSKSLDKIVDIFKARVYNSTDNMSNDTLKNIGLTDYESQIYEILLKLGEIPMAHLTKKSGLKHSTVYSVVDSLVKKRLVMQRDIKKKLHVKAESPTKLLEIAKSQYTTANSSLASVQSMLPFFLSLYINSTVKPTVKTFEGIEGVKQVYQDILNEKKFIYSLLKIGACNNELLNWINTVYTKRRIAENIHTNVIIANDSLAKGYKARDVKELRTTRIVSNSSFPLENAISIYGEKIAFIYQSDEYPLLGIIIQHPKIVATCKSWFDLAWIGAGIGK